MLFYVAVFLIVSNMTISISCKRFTEIKLLTYLLTIALRRYIYTCCSVLDVLTRLGAGRSGVQIPTGARIFSLLQKVLTDFGSHPASYLLDAGRSVPGGEGVAAYGWPHISVAEVNNERRCTSSTIMYLHDVCRERFTFFTVDYSSWWNWSVIFFF